MVYPMPADATSTARLLISCADARGIVAAVTGFIADHAGNLLDAEQHTDTEHGEFFMRAVFDLDGCDLSRSNFASVWAPVADRFAMHWQVYWSDNVKRVAILVGKQSHCLQDLLWRWQAGELDVDIPVIVSNHPTLETLARDAGIPFHLVPIEVDGQQAQEEKIRRILDDAGVDLVVLARYMRILQPPLVAAYANRMINIHHSFLPAFAGGDSYRQAYERGVKIIGATSHYVTEELDRGPIITQAVAEVSHHDAVADLRRRGRDLERIVLARAVGAHLDDRILVSRNKTVVFS